MKHAHRLATLILTTLLALAASPRAQTFEPVLIVNDRAITQYEINQRARLLTALGAAGDTSALARSVLIDDRIKMSVAERLQIEANPEDIDSGIAEFAGQRQLEPGQLLEALDQRGVAESTLRDLIEVGLIWRNVVQARFRARARPSDQDLETALDFANRRVEEQVLLQEIALSTEELGPEQAEELGDKLSRQLNRGGDFTAAVRRYSRAPSLVNDGRLDWVAARDLPPQIALQALALMPGEVTAAIPLGAGISIFKLRDIREVPRPRSETAGDLVTYYRLIQPLPQDAPARAVSAARSLAADVRQNANTCTDLDARVAEFGAGSGRSAPTPASALPTALAAQLDPMKPGDIQINRAPEGVVLLMLCDRSGQISPEEREALRVRLFNERISSYAQGFLQELRGNAVIVEK